MSTTPPPDPYGQDPYGQWDAAYVLGALSPAERREFEVHLAGCSSCQNAVSELAGMPGLLAQMTPEDAAVFAQSIDDPDELVPPQSLMPGVTELPQARRARPRRFGGGGIPGTLRRGPVLIAVAAALALLLGVIGVLALRGALPGGTSTAAFRLAFSPLAPTAITANVDVVPLPDGTDFRVECQYGESNEPTPGGAYEEYAIVVTDRSGHATQVKTWKARPNRKMTPEARSSLPVSKIASIEIRTVGSDQALLRAQLR